jgi:hypothetical protein
MSIITIFTGSRHWSDRAAVVDAFDHAESVGIYYVVTGDQRGLDRLAYEVARERKLHVVPVHAWWKEDGRVAGTVRNFQMVDVAVSLAYVYGSILQLVAYAFPLENSVGTWHCVRALRQYGVESFVYGNLKEPT